MNNFSIILDKKINKYIKLNNLTYMSFRNNGLGDPTSIIKRGSTKTITLFKISKFLDIDVRNLLMFNDNTYIFENSFKTFEEFLFFLGKRFKDLRLQKGLKAVDIDSYRVGRVYAFENNKEGLSLIKFYSYLDKLGMSSDQFFLDGENYKLSSKYHEEYKILDNNQEKEETKDENYINITMKDIFNRMAELEDIRGVKIAKSVIPTRSMMPTVHVFLNICKSLKVSPYDFMDFDNKIPEYKKIEINNREYISNLRKTIQAESENSQKFLRLDNIFNYCNHNNIDVKLFLEEVNEKTNKNKELNIDRRNSL
ncbi:Phage protein [Candidatus Arthromitus sp. SFB-mouse-NL]|uniref:transcriptional regulator n=1 Tax=Candidatus Arthromitus sp. SFB-mouse-NL TaxID=1508644 RepID=UPI00049ADF20|nr:transcriptional regulator [Candidatus Arthromitus sp. SFB-mouse-NL]AID44711.1 Phage protein [Candidatus Arthromitus sp. SFB-mouse-NL]